MFLLIPARWTRKNLLAGVALVLVLSVAYVLLQPKQIAKPLFFGSIPIPFAYQDSSSLRGSLTLFGQRNGIDVYEVAFDHAEPSELLVPDRIYLVHVPNDKTVLDGAFDLALTLVSPEGSHLVDYYGYRYSDPAATTERRDLAALKFSDRFPGQFFASKIAREHDMDHGNMLANFEAGNGITLRATDGRVGGVRMDPAGALYVLIINAEGGARLAVRGVRGCGNKIIEAPEQCDDGNVNDDDNCHNDCSIGLPLPFDQGPTGAGENLTLVQSELSGAALAGTGRTDLALLRFRATALDPVEIKHLVFTANTGSLTRLEHYALWRDTDGDHRVDTRITPFITPVGQLLTFHDPIDWSGAIVDTEKNSLFELRADVPSTLSGVSVLRLALATTEAGYIAAQRSTGTFPLSGIRTDTVCLSKLCQILVTTRLSTLWTLGEKPAVPIAPECGNGHIVTPEECDDGGVVSGDGCSEMCVQESGFTCAGEPSQCTQNIPPASSSTPVCGNAATEGEEQCDDGQLNGHACEPVVSGTCTFCSATCTTVIVQAAAVCGNGTRETGEGCDDQNTGDSDGCSEVCTVEPGFMCDSASPSQCSPSSASIEIVKALADTDHDGVVSEQEAEVVTRALGEIDGKSFDEIKQFDVNGDEVVNKFDVLLILRILDTLAPPQ